MKNHSPINTHYRSCNLCEAICGLIIEHKEGRVLSIKGDSNDPFSKGHICPKAVALQDVYNDPNRLKHPIKKTPSGWVEITWRQAYNEIEGKIKALQKEHGKDSIAFYQGNPSVHNYGSMLFSGGLRKALQTNNNYSATSLDQLPHQYVAQLMFGHSLMIPIPDIDRTDFFLIIGGNPLVSNGSMMTAPGMANRIKAIQKRRGKVVVIDPRRTETAKKADQHIFINPETDVYLVLALLNEVFATQRVNLKHAENYSINLDKIKELVLPYTPQNVSAITKVDVSIIKLLAKEFASAKTAVCYGRMGVSVQTHGTTCQWLMNVLNIITGNFDSPGGHMFTKPAVTIRRGKQKSPAPRWVSRVSNKPEIMGELPMAVFAEEITTPGEGKIRGFIVSAGNPVLSAPNGKKTARALEQLDFMLAIDIFLNETTQYADIILPPATGLEVDHYDLIFNSFAVRNVAKYSPALFKPAPNTQDDWQIFKALAKRLNNNPTWKSNLMIWWQTPTRLLNLGLKTGPYGKTVKLSLKKLKANPHGIDLGPLTPMMPKHLFTPDKQIDLAPEILLSGMKEVYKRFTNNENSSQLKLISRRNLRSNNSWMHNVNRLAGGSNKCTLHINPKDAQERGITDNDTVTVQSKTGSVKVTLEFTDDMMPGVVSLPHGWGNSMHSNPGVSINDLIDETRIDTLTGNAAFSGVEVEVTQA